MNDLRFPVEIVWPGDKRVIASVPGKPSIEIGTPPEFNGAHPDVATRHSRHSPGPASPSRR